MGIQRLAFQGSDLTLKWTSGPPHHEPERMRFEATLKIKALYLSCPGDWGFKIMIRSTKIKKTGSLTGCLSESSQELKYFCSHNVQYTDGLAKFI